ncbi:MAG: aspartate kinase [Candidatus Lernaella stagnicola]|nr:aspartate kinase [Candidatus Lernaella stagnicola]
MAIIVQKYGGTSLGSIERIREVARRVVATHEAGNEVVVVVSAMAGETDRLLGLAAQITERPNDREVDQLLATGEQVSIALLAMAIESTGHQARSFLAHQVRIRTDNRFSRANIISIDPDAILDRLGERKIAVVAGFQGVDVEGNVTTLGRGGSDTTAVALAAALKADVCEIYTDVDGVYTTDPHLCPTARKLDRISHDEMLELASLGAKVLHIRAVAFAKKFGVPLHVRCSYNDRPGTWVVPEDSCMESAPITGVTYVKDEMRIRVLGVPDRPAATRDLIVPLGRAGLRVDTIVQNAGVDGFFDLSFTVPKTEAQQARELAEHAADDLGAIGVELEGPVAKVSVIGVGLRTHTQVPAKVFETLAAHDIPIQMVASSEIKLSVIIDEVHLAEAVRALHTAFELDQGDAGCEEV